MRSKIAVGAAAIMLPALLPLGSSAMADSQPQILQGTLVDSHGSPVQAKITVSVESQSADGLDAMETPIATGFSTPSGQFLIRGGLGKAPATYNPDGSVPLQVDAVANGRDRIFFLDATPPDPQHGRPDWTWGQMADPEMLPPQASDQASDALASAEAHKPLSGLQMNTGSTLDASSSTARMATTSSSYSCDAGYAAHIVWSGDGNWVWRKVPQMHIHQHKRAYLGMKYESSDQTKLGIAVVADSGESWAGGMSYSITQKQDNGFTQNINGTGYTASWNGRITMQWHYLQQKEYCYYVDPYGVEQHYYMATRRWKGYKWSGGVGTPTDSVSYSTSQCTTSTANSWYNQSGLSHTFKGWFGIAGVKLSAAYTTATNVAEHAQKRPGYKTARYCGLGNNMPAQAPIFWEVHM